MKDTRLKSRIAPFLVSALFYIACSPGDSGTGSGDGDAEPGDGDTALSGGSGGGSGTGGDASATGGAPIGDGDGDVVASGGLPAATGGDGSGGLDSGSGGVDAGTGGHGQGTGGTPPVDECTPNPGGTFVTDADTVFDEKTCLTWMRANTSGDPYAAAVTYCDDLTLGGYEDWRIPTAGEIATIFKCDGMWPPIDDTVFTVMGDGVWTSTESGTVAGDLPKVCGAGQSSGNYYDFGQVGGQNTRCVRGSSTVPDRTDCKTNTVICQ